jgi:hypothetical protein
LIAEVSVATFRVVFRRWLDADEPSRPLAEAVRDGFAAVRGFVDLL